MSRQLRNLKPERRHLALALAAALAMPGVALAQDSGMGVDLQFGNPLDPTGQNAPGCTPGGSSWLNDERKHTPTGAMFACRPDYPDFKTGEVWRSRGTIGIGYISVNGDEDNTAWRRFSNYEDGVIFGANLRFEKPADGHYADVRSSFINQDSYYLRTVFGQAGKYRVQAFARAQSNVTSGNARSIWDGVGSNHLTLKAGLTPAASTSAQVAAVSAASPEETLRVVRDKQGVGISYFLNPRWTFFGNASHESREGARPFGGPFFFSSFGGIYETPRPIDDSTINFNGGARYTGKKWRMSFSYTGSFFRNNYSSYDYEVPFRVFSPFSNATTPIPSGAFAYEPENDYHNLKASFTRKLDKQNGEFSLALSGSRSRQNDNLIPHIDCQGVLGIPLPGGQINCADWNTTAGLSRPTADLAINSHLVDARLVMQPSNKFTWRITARHQRDDYAGTYNSYNPLTGQWGYIAENGAQGSAILGEMGVWDTGVSNHVLTRTRNLPLDKQTQQLVVAGDWRLGNKNTLGASYTFDRVERTHREVATSRDNSVKLTWHNRALDWLTFRANYTWTERSGSEYNEDPYDFSFSSSLPGYVAPATGTAAHTVAQLRKYDVGGLTRNKLHLQAMFTLPHDMTISAQLRGESNDYDAELGRTGWDTFGTSVQWDWQPTDATVASAWYGYDRADLDIANVNDSGAMTSDPNLGGANYPDANRWWMTDKQRNHYAGANLSQRIGRATLTADWNYLSSRGDTGYRYNSAGALSVPADFVPGMSGAFPEMRWRINTVTVGISFPVGERINLRLFDTWQKGSLFDWHYSGFQNSQVIGTMAYSDGGPESYSVNMVGLMMEMKL